MSQLCDGIADVYNETFPRARRRHVCGACGETIATGDVYARVVIIGDRELHSVKRCARCQALHVHLRHLCKRSFDRRWALSIPVVALWPDEDLACGLSYEDEWGAVPAEVAELAFIRADELLLAAFLASVLRMLGLGPVETEGS